MMDNTLHDLIVQLGELRTQKKALEYEANQIGRSIELVERDLIMVMDAQHITESKSAAGKVTVGEAVYPQVQNWDEFHQWILENGYLHFLERRAAVLAYREALGQNIPVPGVLPFTKRKITFKEA
jgi:hypothetical protein